MSKIITYSLEQHKNIFEDKSNNNDYLYVKINDHPYIDVPYRAVSYAIEFLKKGSIIMQTQLHKIVINAPAIFAIGPNVIRGFTKNSDEILMEIIFFKPEFFLENQTNVFFLSEYEFFEKSDRHVFNLEEENIQKMELLFNSIQEVTKNNSPHKASILRSYLYILIFELDTIKQVSETNLIQNPLFQKFKEILQTDFTEQRSVGHYAKKLNITDKYLSEIVKKNSGKTTRDWINEMVILEAKVLLQDKKLSISQISNTLNFSTQSVFGKFFKKCTGVSPAMYRNR